jgi:hypothetical protein
MKLNTLEDLLQTHSDKQFALVLPNQNAIPISFHITEVAYVQKRFIDCGGKLHTDKTCQLQAWVHTDTDHRLLAGKIAGVFSLARSKGILPDGEDLDIEIEYEDTAISQYTVESCTVSESAVVLSLASKHTNCLAKEICVPNALALPMATGETSCGCGPGCC